MSRAVQHYPAIRHGMPLAAAIEACRALGGAVEEAHHGGETRFSHPLVRARIVVHSQRRDTTVELCAWLRSVERRHARFVELAEMDDQVRELERRGDQFAADFCRNLVARMRQLDGIPAEVEP